MSCIAKDDSVMTLLSIGLEFESLSPCFQHLDHLRGQQENGQT